MPAKKRKGDATREKFWRLNIARQVSSCLTQGEFCEQEGLNPNTFSYWKKEIRLRDARKKSSKQGTNQNIVWTFEDKETVDSPFVPVVVEDRTQPEKEIYLLAEIRFSFATISVFSGANSCTLRDLVRACKECCD